MADAGTLTLVLPQETQKTRRLESLRCEYNPFRCVVECWPVRLAAGLRHMNRILYAADCLDVLHDEDELPSESIDLIYLDPPFNSNSNYNLPFKGRDKSLKPVEAFTDTWEWTADDNGRLNDMERDPRTRSLATIVKFAGEVERVRGGRGRKPSLAAYLINMSLRLLAMRRVLKKTGSIYLHCDTTAGHYLKLLMDSIWGFKNFRNAVVWQRYGSHNDAKKFGRVYDMILFYAKDGKGIWNGDWTELDPDYIRTSYRYQDDRGKYTTAPLHTGGLSGGGYTYEFRGHTRTWRYSEERMRELESDNRIHQAQKGAGPPRRKVYLSESKGKPISNLWTDIKALTGSHKERLGYPTQKPLALLERIIKASSNPGDMVLDPFCGCGTTVHAAESLGRRWMGIDISPFATGLMRERMVDNFPLLAKDDILIRGIPHTIEDAQALAKRDKFEFEKWVCGFIGAEGMFREPGTRGADGGVDGLLKFYRFVPKKVAKAEYAIVQVKGGRVSADAVRALRETVDRLGVTAGVMVCFEQYMRTVENQRSRDSFEDVFGSYPVIQGYSVEKLLANAPLDLPTYGRRRKGGLLNL